MPKPRALSEPDIAEVEQLAEEIAKKVWNKVRRLISRQQRELHDYEEDE